MIKKVFIPYEYQGDYECDKLGDEIAKWLKSLTINGDDYIVVEIIKDNE